jgi:hypothetical protein
VRDQLGIPSLLLELRRDGGWPDVLFLIPGGRPLFMEFKRPGKDLEPLQVERKTTLQKLGYDVLGPVDNVDIAVSLVTEALTIAERRVLKYKYSALWSIYD